MHPYYYNHKLLANPFIGVHSPSITKSLRTLLASDRVTWINFDFGSVRVRGEWYRDLAGLFADHIAAPGIKTMVNPYYCITQNADAVYDSVFDTIHFRRFDVLNSEDGRDTAVHECTHAMCDYRGRSTAILTEEGAAYLAGALYRLTANVEDPIIAGDTPEPIFDVAMDLKNRILSAHSGIARATAQEIQRVRSAVFNIRDDNGDRVYEMSHYVDHNGVGGHRSGG